MIQLLTSLPLWFINGTLYVLYWIAGNLLSAYSFGIALFIAFGIDPHIQSRAVDRPRRYGRGVVSTGAPPATYLTLVTAIIWMGVSSRLEVSHPADRGNSMDHGLHCHLVPHRGKVQPAMVG